MAQNTIEQFASELKMPAGALLDQLAANGVTTRDALADLATDELTEMTGIADERAVDLIMKARAHWFEAEPELKNEPASSAAATVALK